MDNFLDLNYDKIKQKLYFLDKEKKPVFFKLKNKNEGYLLFP